MRIFSIIMALSAIGAVASASATVSGNESVETMKNFYKIADSRPFNVNKLKEFYSKDFIDHDADIAQKHQHKKNSINTFVNLANGAPDSQHIITFMEPVGKNKVLIRWKFQGTHTGNLFGMSPTKRGFNIAGMELWELKNGKITGLWHVEEIAKLIEQLNVK